LRDLDWATDRADEIPVYLVLNACRIWAAQADRLVLSKREGAEWANPRLPDALRKTVKTAAGAYAGQDDMNVLSAENSLECAEWINQRMRAEL
jgi:hypothetical protein